MQSTPTARPASTTPARVSSPAVSRGGCPPPLDRMGGGSRVAGLPLEEELPRRGGGGAKASRPPSAPTDTDRSRARRRLTAVSGCGHLPPRRGEVVLTIAIR